MGSSETAMKALPVSGGKASKEVNPPKIGLAGDELVVWRRKRGKWRITLSKSAVNAVKKDGA